MSARISSEFAQPWSVAQLDTKFPELGMENQSEYVTARAQEAATQKLPKREGLLKKVVFSKKVIYMVIGLKIVEATRNVIQGKRENGRNCKARPRPSDWWDGHGWLTVWGGSIQISVKSFGKGLCFTSSPPLSSSPWSPRSPRGSGGRQGSVRVS
ncbi:uncharacterized protein ColSpa_08323 [Colletotrichum spaethianum]|uniref:Uncharacterized protein n=1 Tax=Colletotrichum spaethianum TaxID=700344 RepID=A0AA37P9J5_9PEZI|nr:uncharacterized protein ColSpa_08323 [Colletotrichum spaethianum]GKT48142.1 hypothetical protein ColSpa_08323 [Colletotrichum spaethianum]